MILGNKAQVQRKPAETDPALTNDMVPVMSGPVDGWLLTHFQPSDFSLL